MIVRVSFIVLLLVLLAQVCAVGQTAKKTRAKTGILIRAAAKSGGTVTRVSHRRSLPSDAPRRGRRIKSRRSRKLTTPNPTVTLKTSLTTHLQGVTPVPLRVAPPHRTSTTMAVLPTTFASRRPVPALTPPPLRGFKVSSALNDAPPAIRPPPGVAKKLNMANINDFMRLARFMLRRRRTQRKIQRPPKRH
uniref:Expressed conserved protein n=1 Tax=Bursaphelenchus xylophilus TaxID=6326 RepID=A0A1I7RQR9_BURXY